METQSKIPDGVRSVHNSKTETCDGPMGPIIFKVVNGVCPGSWPEQKAKI